MTTRRDFLRISAAGTLATIFPSAGYAVGPTQVPRITFYGSTRQVSGSCHLLETSHGLFVIDCGLFISDVPDPAAENRDLPFDPKEVKAIFLTHAHTDHNGRLPFLYKKGFRGPIYCTDASRDLTEIMLNLSASLGELDEEPLYDQKDASGVLRLLKVIPYNRKFEAEGLTVRYTDAGHILGSAMVELWVDGRKLLFSGDMGPDHSPILCKPTQHYGADAVLVESTYGPSPRSFVSYEEFGKKIATVLERGGSVLIPSFAIHKTQIIIYVLHQLIEDGLLPKDVPIFSDSTTAQKCTAIYDAYAEYHDAQARAFAGKRNTLFYRNRYREGRVADVLKTHNAGPAIYISTSGMLSYAAAPQHLAVMASDPKNAVFIPGYQAPGTTGRELLDGKKRVTLNLDEFVNGERRPNKKEVDIRLEVDRVSGFSSHAVGEQILEWVHHFERVGPVYVVHGDEERSVGLAAKLQEMKVESLAPKRNDTFVVKGDRVKPGEVPKLEKLDKPAAPAVVDK